MKPKLTSIPKLWLLAGLTLSLIAIVLWLVVTFKNGPSPPMAKGVLSSSDNRPRPRWKSERSPASPSQLARWQKLKVGQALMNARYGWRCYQTNDTFLATHKELSLSVELVSQSGTPRVLSWQQERGDLWSLTYYAGSPGTHFICDVIRRALINVRTRQALVDEVFRYENPLGEGTLPAAPTWTWTTNALIIRDPESGNAPVTIPMNGMK